MYSAAGFRESLRAYKPRVLADPDRKITRNRQPGRCCATGCQATELSSAAG